MTSHRRLFHAITLVSAVILPLTGWTADTNTRNKTTDLMFAETVSNVDLYQNRIRLPSEYIQEGTNSIWMEAEQASVLKLDRDRGKIESSPDASGGLCIVFAEQIEFHVDIKTPGRYTAWYRGLFPSVGGWLHFDNMDGNNSQSVADSNGEKTNQWVWTKGPTYTLSKGKHSWNLAPYGWWGGAKLDKVVLIGETASEPAGLGDKAALSVLPKTGEVLSTILPSTHVVKWEKLKLENATGKGVVSPYVSMDKGKTWQTVPPDGSLASVPGTNDLVFKVAIQADADGASPWITSAQVDCISKRLPDILLENDKAQLRFSGENGALIGIRNLATQTDYISSGMETPLFTFKAFRGESGPVKDIAFSQAEMKRADVRDNKLTMEFNMMGGGISVQCTFRLETNGLVRLSMAVANQSPYTICRVVLPDLKGLCIGGNPMDDLLFTPILTGGIAPYPASLKLPRMAYTDRALYYPGMATMCWMDVWDEKGGGLYVAFEDKAYRVTEITFSTSASDEMSFSRANQPNPPSEGGYQKLPEPGRYINIGFIKDIRIDKRTKTVQLPDLVLGIHSGDWHWGADRYREWAQTWMKKAKVPDWLMDTDGWSVGHMTHFGTFADLAKERSRDETYREKYNAKNPPYPVWYYMAQKEEMIAAPPPINRILGTEEILANSVQKQHEMGHRMMFYILPPDFAPDYTRERKRLGCMPGAMVPDDEVPPKGFYGDVALRNTDGSMMYSDGTYQDTPVCMASTKWQDFMSHMIVDKYVKQYGCDGMYLDGTGLVSFQCFGLKHGHDDYGEWTRGFNDLMRRIKPPTESARPGAIYVGEGMGDVENQYLDFGLAYPDNAPFVHRYTIPWSIGMVLLKPPYFKEFPESGTMYEWDAVYGYKAWGLNVSSAKDMAREDEILAFRKLYSQFQTRARFMDEVGLHLAEREIIAKLFVRDEAGTKGALVAVFNDKGKAGVTASVDAGSIGQLKSAWAFTLDGALKPVQIRTEGSTYWFEIPASRLSAILLLERCEPMIHLDHVDPVVPGETGTAHVTVRNLDAEVLKGSVGFLLPRKWTVDSQNCEIRSGESARFDIPFRVARRERFDLYDIYAVVKEQNRETKRCLPMGVCRPVQAEMYYINGRTISLDLENVGSRAITGVCALTPPAPVTVDKNNFPFELAPKGKTNIAFYLFNTEAIKTREFIKAVLTYDKLQTVAYEVVQPPVLNGGFEQDTAGDGNPDYWNYRFPNELYMKGVTLDTTTFVEGKQSLRLEPYEKSERNCLSSTYLRLVPNTDYRFSCSIKRTINHPGINAYLFSMYHYETSKDVRVTLGAVKDAPPGVWVRYSATFKTPNILVPYQILLNNCTKGQATVWFDDIQIEEIKQ